MKKITFIIAIVLLAITNVHSQNEDNEFQEKKTQFGIKLGYSSTLDTNLLRDGFTESSIYFGGFAEKRINNRWAFQAEFNIVMDEFAFKDLINVEFETPILAKYYLNDKISIFAGPQIDTYLSKRKMSFQLSGVIGTQVNLSKRFFIESRYNFRFKGSNVDQSIRPFSEKSDLEIGLGFKF